MIDSLIKREPREVATVAFCLVAILAAAVLVYAVQPFWKAHQNATQKYGQASRVGLLVAPNGQAELGLQAEIERLQKALEGDRANVPSQEIESFVIGRLQTVAWRHSLELRSMEPSRGELTDEYDELLFQVTLSGEYFAVGQWLKDVHRELGFVVVREFQLRENGGPLENPTLSARFLLSSYRLKPGAV